jgi:hypothetical protein
MLGFSNNDDDSLGDINAVLENCRFVWLLFEYLAKNGEIPDNLRGAVRQLRVWAENVGAHRTSGSASLDHCLWEATRFRGHVKVLLQDLNVVVKESE